MLKVEDRLPFIIRKRLEAEIRKKPPLFPWEQELEEYEATDPESGNTIPIDSSIPAPESAPPEE